MTAQALDRPAVASRDTRSAPRSVGLADTVRQSFTMGYRGMLKIRHNPEQLFDVVFQPVVFTLMFTYIFGGALAGSVSQYLPIIIPGILVQTVITTSVVTGTQLREDMNKGVFDRFKSLPIARTAPLAGALLADVVRYLIATVITFVVGIAMGWRPDPLGLIGATVLVIICSFAVSWIWALMGMLVKKASAVQGFSLMILFPLTFVSNAFVQPETMPGWLQAFVKVNPVSNLVTSVRELTNNGHIGIHVLWSLLGAAILVAVFAPLTVRAYMRNA
ncbi:ABC transporter [Williamsia sp. Leaf354]|jgi:ABC-2 type transport system permease protein|uniref:ABC transporter permease n=1 Tax=Williamsia sp. Leaf354 TaxID=1736349 RepID=UPI0006F7F51D|nr:ABC transporter permease [Williamsia sp. Leaf354]KQR96276.1 ABC transporter [Williamsia sp. Leaf354]